MPTHRENFDSWFVKVLESLYPCRDAGFVILMAALPLLERYLRQRAGIPAENDKLTPAFYDELHKLFPELDAGQAQKFWTIYRNGLLHQVTFSQRAQVIGLVSHDTKEAISIDERGNFCIHLVRFAKRVLEKIENEFSKFEGASSAAPPLPTVGPHQMAPNAPIILGTRGTSEARELPPIPLETQLC